MTSYPSWRDQAPLPPLHRAGQCAAPLVISPHLDDAVFSCGALLAAIPGSTVCTVFAGAPDKPQRRAWDVAAGFRDSTTAMTIRTREDAQALALCGARAERLSFLDRQYDPLPDDEAIESALVAQLAKCPGAPFVVPLGLRHPDHRRVAEAWLTLLRSRLIRSCIVYEEAIHRTARGLTEQRLRNLSDVGLRADALDATWCPERTSARATNIKRCSVLAYDSQLRAFGSRVPADLAQPERYWHVYWAMTPPAPRTTSSRNPATG